MRTVVIQKDRFPQSMLGRLKSSAITTCLFFCTMGVRHKYKFSRNDKFASGGRYTLPTIMGGEKEFILAQQDSVLSTPSITENFSVSLSSISTPLSREQWSVFIILNPVGTISESSIELDSHVSVMTTTSGSCSNNEMSRSSSLLRILRALTFIRFKLLGPERHGREL